MIRASFQIFGKVDVVRIVLKICVLRGKSLGSNVFRSLGLTSARPVALDLFAIMDCRTSQTLTHAKLKLSQLLRERTFSYGFSAASGT